MTEKEELQQRLEQIEEEAFRLWTQIEALTSTADAIIKRLKRLRQEAEELAVESEEIPF